MLNKKNNALWIMAILFLFTTSFHQKEIFKKSGFSTVKLTFNNTVKNSKIVLKDSLYTNCFGEKYTITKLRYYISNVSFKGAGNNFTEKNSYHLIDESDSGSQSFSFSVPEGNYTSLHFLLGVDSLHNVSGAQSDALDPSKDMFWTWNTGYVMAKLEGNSSSSGLVNNKYEFHIGGFSGKYKVLKNIKLYFPENKSIKLKANKTTAIMIVADINTWWQNPNDIKIAAHANITTPGKLASAMSDNYSKMFHVEKIISK